MTRRSRATIDRTTLAPPGPPPASTPVAAPDETTLLAEETLFARRHPNDATGGAHEPTRAFLIAARRDDAARTHRDRQEALRLQAEARRLIKEAEERGRATERLRRHQEWVAELNGAQGDVVPRAITPVPPLPEGAEPVTFREVIPGRAFLRVSYDRRRNRHMYEVIEPRLDPTEREVLEFLRDTLVRTLPGRRADLGETEHVRLLEEAVQRAVLDHSILIDEVGMHRVLYLLTRDFLGHGPIDVLMRDPLVEDVSCDGPGIPLFVFHRDHGSIVTNLVFDDPLALDGYVIRLAQRSGKHISIANPLLDATLPDGSRLQASLSREVTTRGSSFTIRRFRGEPLTPVELVRLGSLDARMAAYFWILVEHGASLVLAGGTASGKTTTLNAICQYIPPERKIVSIEDTREINLRHENWIAGVTRSGFGAGEAMAGVDMYRLLEAALRQRPEYLVVGEVRGKEALTLFQAMATGHAVYSTMHADSVASAVYRLENPPINVPRLMLQTLDVMAIQALDHDGARSRRRIREVTEFAGFDPDSSELLTNTVFRWDDQAEQFFYTGRSVLLDEYRARRRMDVAALNREWGNRRRVVEWMVQNEIHGFAEVAQVIAQYYRQPAAVMAVVEQGGRGPEW